MSKALRTAVLPALVALLPAGYFLWSYRTAPANYAAVYSVAGAWLVAAAVVVTGALLAIPPRTRDAGARVCLTGVFILAEFLVVQMTVARRADEPPLGSSLAHEARIAPAPPPAR